MVSVHFSLLPHGLVSYMIVLTFSSWCLMDRYRLMLDCWGELTNERPSFNDIEARLDSVLQHVADRVIWIYLQINRSFVFLFSYKNQFKSENLLLMKDKKYFFLGKFYKACTCETKTGKKWGWCK